MSAKLYRSKRVLLIREMVEEDRYVILYDIPGAFDPALLPLAYVYKDPFIENPNWIYMTEEDFAKWKELEELT